MPTIAEEIRRLLPHGSRLGSSGRRTACPLWPPDLFAVAASLVRLSQCYTWPEFVATWDSRVCRLNGNYVDDVTRIGATWAETAEIPADLATLWQELLNSGTCDVGRERPIKPWAEIAIRLMAIADEAASGIGFVQSSPFGSFVFAQHLAHVRKQKPLLPHIPLSLCMMVPIQEACVQPKSNTPQVGCTLRSLTHNLALLPPERTVAISWLFNTSQEAANKPLNLLVVPFPYSLRGRDFVEVASTKVATPEDRFFSLDPSWLRYRSRKISAAKIAGFLSELVISARAEVDEVHGIVLPEAALDEQIADQVASRLAKRNPDLELFITGVVSRSRGSQRNWATTYRFNKKRVWNSYRQSKHHRWCLDSSQISRYHLGHKLNPTARWWEQIYVDDRALAVSVVRDGASLAVLICEDLARHDPVMPALQAVGPNLVIGLLMDGPQMERRWPGRYATVLAEDPGSSVLTLTCLGMVRRSSMPGETERREIALWKQRGSDAKELRLPPGDLALLLSLTLEEQTQMALDGRSDRQTSRQFSLSGVRGIRTEQRPTWLSLD